MEIDQETLLALSDSGKWRLKELDLLRRIEEAAKEARAEAASAREAVERVEKSAKEAHGNAQNERTKIKAAFNRVWRALVAAVKDYFEA